MATTMAEAIAALTKQVDALQSKITEITKLLPVTSAYGSSGGSRKVAKKRVIKKK